MYQAYAIFQRVRQVRDQSSPLRVVSATLTAKPASDTTAHIEFKFSRGDAKSAASLCEHTVIIVYLQV